MMKNLLLFLRNQIVLSAILLTAMTPANSTESYEKQWTVATVILSSKSNPNFKYYLEPQLRLINDRYVFNQLLLLGGLGYQFTNNLILFVGPGWIVTKNPQGIMRHEQRLWEQLNWLATSTDNFSVISRTRLEERKDTDYSQIAIRFRERAWLRIPFPQWYNHSFSCYDEVFFNFNHPVWTSPYFFEQNRAFIGLGTQLSSSTILDVGYLNQYLHNRTNQIDNVFLISFTVNN